MTRWASSPGLSIRSRLTAWYTVVLFLMMLVYAAATYVAVRHEFLEQLDEQSHGDVESGASSRDRVQAQLREVLIVLVLGLPIVVRAGRHRGLRARPARADAD